MNTIKVGNHTVTVYEGIDEMPIVRYQKFNRLMLIESDVLDSSSAAEDVFKSQVARRWEPPSDRGFNSLFFKSNTK